MNPCVYWHVVRRGQVVGWKLLIPKSQWLFPSRIVTSEKIQPQSIYLFSASDSGGPSLKRQLSGFISLFFPSLLTIAVATFYWRRPSRFRELKREKWDWSWTAVFEFYRRRKRKKNDYRATQLNLGESQDERKVCCCEESHIPDCSATMWNLRADDPFPRDILLFLFSLNRRRRNTKVSTPKKLTRNTFLWYYELTLLIIVIRRAACSSHRISTTRTYYG